jgi:hypothetical protein
MIGVKPRFRSPNSNRVRPPEKTYVRVADAVRAGAETSRDVAAVLKIPRRLATSHLCIARYHGLIEKNGLFHHYDAQTPAIRWRAV